MKRGPHVLGTALLLGPTAALGADFGLQPRLDTGFLYYEYTQDAFRSPAIDVEGSTPNSASSLEYSDTLAFFSGGVTFFSNRWFFDIGVRHAFNGSSSDDLRNQNFLSGGGFIEEPTVFTTQTKQKADFDRTEWAISIGYGLTESVSIYAGYLGAETEFDTALRGTIDVTQISDQRSIPQLTGTFTSRLNQTLQYDGPFVGASLSLPISKGPFNGVLSGNIAVAFLDGTVDLDFDDFLIQNELDQAFPFDLETVANTQGRGSFSEPEGDTVGLSLGLSWKGATPVEGLTYTVGVNGFRYDFDSDDTPDFSEIQFRFNAGLAYTLEF